MARSPKPTSLNVDPQNPAGEPFYDPDADSGMWGDAIAVDAGLGADVELGATREGETLEQTIERIRKTRTPLGAFSQKLAYAPRPGYYRHWFNDSPGRVQEAVQGGWSHVTADNRKPVARHVGSGRDGKGLMAYLLEIPEVIREEDQQRFHDIARARIDGLKRNPFPVQPGSSKAQDKGKFYDPHEDSGAGAIQIVKS